MLSRLVALCFVLILAGCSFQQSGVTSSGPENFQRDYRVVENTFSTIPDLDVSEAEGFYPFADVVWRGDPRGDRIAQIAAMFDTAFDRNDQILNGAQPVVVDIQLVRFHGVTNQTRYTVGGVYNILFNMTVRDARTGAVIEPARRVSANLDAPGGAEAIRLEETGQTQKVRVVNFLTSVLRGELR